jgi:hypothetical protein
MQEFQPLGRQLQGQIMNAGGVATRSGEARDKTRLDRVYGDAEDDRDWDRRCGGFGRGRDEGAARRGDNGHAPANEISHQQRQPIELVVQPVALYGYISVLDVSNFAEAFAERGQSALRCSGRPGVDERYCWRRLLCRRAKRQRRRGTDPSDELAPPHQHTPSCNLGGLTTVGFHGQQTHTGGSQKGYPIT